MSTTLKTMMLEAGWPRMVLVVVTDELDRSTVTDVQARLDEALELRPDRIVVDLLAGSSADPTAAGLLGSASRRARRAGCEILVRTAATG